MEPDLVVARICCLVSRILLQTPAAFFGLLARAALSVPVRLRAILMRPPGPPEARAFQGGGDPLPYFVDIWTNRVRSPVPWLPLVRCLMRCAASFTPACLLLAD